MRYRDKYKLLADVVAAHLQSTGAAENLKLKYALEDTGYLPRSFRGLAGAIVVGDVEMNPQQAAGVPAGVPEWAIPLYQTLTQPWPARCTCPLERPDLTADDCPEHGLKKK